MNRQFNKSLKVGIVLFFVLAMSASSLAKEVEVKGVGIAPITKDKASAKRVALMLAKRDAVERAIGAEVQAESIPASELVSVVATTSGRIKFTVVAEGVEGKVYITEIDAKVQIPPELASKYPRSYEKEDTGFKALVQKFPHGELNWEDGYLLVKGSAKKSGTDAKSIAMARRAAQVDAYGLALQMVSGINFDPRETLKARMKKVPAIEYKIKGLIRGAEVFEESSLDKNTYQVTIKVPLRGIKGIQRAFTETMDLKSPTPKKAAGDFYTGVVVDARGLGAKPALFPEIVDEKGEPVYTMEMVEGPSLAMRGGAAYVVGDGKKGASLEKGRYLVVQALSVTPAFGALPGLDVKTKGFSFRSFMGSMKTILIAQARKVILRQGPRPIKPRAIKTSGPTRSRIVISTASAARVRKARSYNDFLGKARVVVITDSMIGGTEGKYLRPGKLYIPSR